MGVPVVGSMMKKMFGTRNERLVKRYLRVVDQVSAFEPEMRKLTDAELRAKTDEFRERAKNGESTQDLTPEVFAVAREAMDRSVGIRNIFNPDAGFDPDRLPADVRRLYDETKAKMAETPDADPAGEFLGCDAPVPSWQFVDIPTAIYDAVRELYPQSKPPFRARPFDVQIIGAVVLYEGRIAEMKTGEGKTIVAPLATYLAVCEAKQVHVVTVNDYLVQRDRDWTFPFFRMLGLTVGAIHPMHMQPPPRKKLSYACDVVYGTTSEFGFDYLRDNMKTSVQEQVQRKRDFAIVDEVDSTLIDEARTPLIISGQAHAVRPRYELADKLARHLVAKQKDWNAADERVQTCMVDISTIEGDIRNAREKGDVPELKSKLDAARERLPELEAERDRHTQYYEVELDKKKATLTHEGIEEAQKEAGVGSFYIGDNIDLPHLLEQSIRAHSVYQRDRDYVVAPDDQGQQSVVIVDQNTGRKMVGRQWSDGLHQAVESKEGVPIKDETQTMATITIQNFFKLYGKLAGMTGTADTEATEFYEIYKLDVVVIPTNVPVVRRDHNDLVFIAEKDKWDAIIDEIKAFHDVGQPILVGTTSVETSQMLSDMLTRRHRIEHEVLNAKQHEREADIILEAGKLGAVMIATNMAGRGTDIKLQPITADDLVNHWKRRGLCPSDVTADLGEEEVIRRMYRHMAVKELGLKKGDVESMSDDDVRLALLREWCERYTWTLTKDPADMSESALVDALDAHGACLYHRMSFVDDTEELGGLHVIGTERHESRRIDNQLRGRAGRQGDPGSSRFFLSLEDNLMKMFAGKTTLGILSKLGMKEGDKIEHQMLTKAVGRAQRKVEERNFLWRKNILEYDEVMDHQRHAFYGERQDILEGRNIKDTIFDNIEQAVDDAVHTYLEPSYVANCVAEWVRENVNVSIDSERIKGKDRVDLRRLVTIDAKEEASSMIRLTINEYMPDPDGGEFDEDTWDAASLANWANANFKAGVTGSELRDMSRREVAERLDESAHKAIDAADLGPLDQFLVPNYGPNELIKWVGTKFEHDLEVPDFVGVDDLDAAVDRVMDKARSAYERRETTYPIEFALDMTTAGMQQDPAAAIGQFCRWVKARYELNWEPTSLPSNDPTELRRILVDTAEKWDGGRIAERASRAVAAAPSPEKLDTWFRENALVALTPEQIEQAEDDPQDVAEKRLTELMRAELTQFERWVLLQIFDQSWKEHLHSMDQLREAIGMRSFAQKDPRIEYKREGGRLFDEMRGTVREKVTDLIFKAKLSPSIARRPAQQPPQQQQQASQPAPPQPAQPAVAAAAAASAGTAAQQRDIEAAERAGAERAGNRPKKAPVKAAPVVGRNEPCPCGSGKKYKQCHGKRG